MSTLGVALGASALVFSAVSAIVLRPLPFTEPDRVAFIWSVDPRRGTSRSEVSPADFLDWRRESTVFADLAAFRPSTMNLTGAGEPVRLFGLRASPNVFRLWGIGPALGRVFRTEEGVAGSNRVVVLSHGFWMRKFGAARGVLGRTLVLDGEPHVVVGVLSPAIEFGNLRRFDLWTPLVIDEASASREARTLTVTGRLRPGATIAAARTEIGAIAARIERQFPATHGGWRANVVSVAEEIRGPGVRLVLAILGVTVGLVLLIACLNVANLMLVRAVGRRREVAVRAALGGSRARVVRQLLVESFVLAAAASVVGFGLAGLGLDLLVALTRGVNAAINELTIDRTVLALGTAVSLVTPLVFGLVPAIHAARSSLTRGLKEGAPGAIGTRRAWGRSALVVVQLALALALLVVAGLFVRTAVAVQQVELGFDRSRLLTLRIDLPVSRYTEPVRAVDFYDRTLAAVSRLPGVRRAGVVTTLPVAGREPTVPLTFEGRADIGPDRSPWTAEASISPGYIGTLGLPLLAGRDLAHADTADRPLVALVSREFVRRYWPGQDAIGRRIALGAEAEPAWIQVVGVVGDVRNSDVDADLLPQVYVPLAQRPRRAMALVVRTDGDPLLAAPAVRREIAEVDPDQPVYDVRSMEQVVYDDLSDTYVIVGLLGVLAGVAFTLAIAGVYGVASYSVSQRTQEFGIRLALGAAARDLVGMLLLQSAKLVAVGLAAGLAGGFALARVASSLLYGVRSTDPATYISVSIALAVAALGATWLPARRALRLNPVTALRSE